MTVLSVFPLCVHAVSSYFHTLSLEFLAGPFVSIFVIRFLFQIFGLLARETKHFSVNQKTLWDSTHFTRSFVQLAKPVIFLIISD